MSVSPNVGREGVPKVVTLTALAAFVTGAGFELRTRLTRRPQGSGPGTQILEWPPSTDELVRVASLRLEELRYQQTVKAGVSGKLSVPFGIEVGATSERSLARYPMTFPEVVDNFAKFLALAPQTRDVLVAVDELDKLESDDDTATRFLNDLKAAFGVANTYFPGVGIGGRHEPLRAPRPAVPRRLRQHLR